MASPLSALFSAIRDRCPAVSLRKTAQLRIRLEPRLELPLLNRAKEGDGAFVVTGASEIALEEVGAYCGAGVKGPALPVPGHGEQYRFHFDMTKCIGCKCCVVACNEQNGNPADILWRRVGEIEGGTYPNTRRHYLSMGCNHCLEPTCMTGCPVDAYSKDPITGIVRHSADACIGCQYCTWNCSYGVPQYNPERGVVGKCDMCYGRLQLGQDPACVSACPEDAIRIEIVSKNEWRKHPTNANAPGMPLADESLSTTRITLPPIMPRDVSKVDLNNLRMEDAHWPLIVMTVLTQLSVGAFISTWMTEMFGAHAHRFAAAVALTVALFALIASTLHLGRPIHALRALKMWRRSWLSREVLLFTLFTGCAAVYSASLWTGKGPSSALGALTVLFGIGGVGASGRLYLAPGRPAWNSPFTIADFFATTALLGAATGAAFNGASTVRAMVVSAAVVILTAILKMAWLARSSVHELHGTWQLLTTVLSNHMLLRFALLVAGLLVIVTGQQIWETVAGAMLIVAGEFLSRYLFFVSVVPTNMAAGYLAQEAA